MKLNKLVKQFLYSYEKSNLRRQIIRGIFTYTVIDKSPVKDYLAQYYSYKHPKQEALNILLDKGHSYLVVTRHTKEELLSADTWLLNYRIAKEEIGMPPVILLSISNYYPVKELVNSSDITVITTDFLYELAEGI